MKGIKQTFGLPRNVKFSTRESMLCSQTILKKKMRHDFFHKEYDPNFDKKENRKFYDTILIASGENETSRRLNPLCPIAGRKASVFKPIKALAFEKPKIPKPKTSMDTYEQGKELAPVRMFRKFQEQLNKYERGQLKIDYSN